MENNAMIKAIEIMKNKPNSMYDYISQHYHEMSKNELADIIKELIYSVDTNVYKPEYNMILGEAANELEGQYMEN